MTPQDLEKINKNISETIKQTVNGKIDRINDKLDTYIKEDNEWKSNVTPSIEIVKKMQGFASVGGWILQAVIIIGSAVGALYAFYKFIIQR